MNATVLEPRDILQLAQLALMAHQDQIAERISAMARRADADPDAVEVLLDDIAALVTRAHALGAQVGERNAKLLEAS